MDAETVSRNGRVLIASLTLGAIALIAATGVYYLRQRKAVEAAATQQLIAVTRGKVVQLQNWRSERLGDGRMLQVSGLTRIAKDALTSPAIEPIFRADLLDVMQKLEREFLYSGVALVDRNGEIRLESDTGPSDPARTAELGKAGSRLKDVTLEDLYWDAKLGRPLMALLIPVQGDGAFVLTIDPERFLYPSIRSWPVPSRTAETLLLRVEGDRLVVLNELRYSHAAPLHFWRKRRSTRPHSADSYRQIVARPGVDYRGIPVLRIAQAVPDCPWIVETKIDLAEVDAPVSRLGWEMASIVALIALANATGVAFIWRNQQIRVYRQREEWQRQMADESPAFLWTTTPDAKNMFINKPLAEFIGGAQEQRLRGSWRTYFHPDEAERVANHFYECVAAAGEFTDEHRLRRFDGEYRWFIAQGRPRFSSQGEYLGHAGALLDITERRLAEHQLEAANTALAQELEERTRAEKEIQALSARLINAQEEERCRLARELHDDLNQQIAVLSVSLSNLKRAIPSELAEPRSQSERIREKLYQLGESTRRLSHELHPAILQYSGLDAALRAHCSELSTLSAIQISFRSKGSFAGLPPAIALCVYRIAQEALANVVKHARTQSAELVLTRSDSSIKLTVSDFGIGMNLDHGRASPGLGLTSMRERARLVNGTVEILSKPGSGTTVTLNVPVTVADLALQN